MSRANGPSFHISWSGAQRAALAALLQRAKSSGVLPGLVADLDELDRRLGSDPAEWSDPIFEYHHLDLAAFHALLSLVHVYYAIDKQRRIVYIKAILPMPCSELDETS